MKPYMNTDVHPDMFQSREAVPAPNQGYFKRNAFDEWKRNQDQMRNRLIQAVANLNRQHKELSVQQKTEINDVHKQLATLDKETSVHEQFRKETGRWLAMLDDNQEKVQQLLEQEGSFKQDLKREMSDLSASQQAVLEELMDTRGHLSSQIERLHETQNHMVEGLAERDEQQTQMINRMDDQGALLEKVSRQINHFRSALFERSSYLAEKIDDGWRQTSEYMYEWLKGNEQSITLWNKKRPYEEEKASEK